MAPSLRLIVANGQPEPILPYEDIQGMRLVLATRRIKYRVQQEESIMKKDREEIRPRTSVLSLITTVEASRTTIAD